MIFCCCFVSAEPKLKVKLLQHKGMVVERKTNKLQAQEHSAQYAISKCQFMTPFLRPMPANSFVLVLKYQEVYNHTDSFVLVLKYQEVYNHTDSFVLVLKYQEVYNHTDNSHYTRLHFSYNCLQCLLKRKLSQNHLNRDRTNFFLNSGWTRPKFITRVLWCYVASTVLVLKLYAYFMKCAGSVRLIGMISVARCMERSSAPSVA